MTTDGGTDIYRANLTKMSGRELLHEYATQIRSRVVVGNNTARWAEVTAKIVEVIAELEKRLAPPTARKLEIRCVDVTNGEQLGPFKIDVVTLPGEAARMFIYRFVRGHHIDDRDILNAIQIAFPSTKGSLVVMPVGAEFEVWEEAP